MTINRVHLLALGKPVTLVAYSLLYLVDAKSAVDIVGLSLSGAAEEEKGPTGARG
jgi:hypothetical protein